jgi:hypothetical protein
MSHDTWGRLKDIVTILVIPALGWVMMQVGAMSKLETEVASLKVSLEESRATIRYLQDRDSNVSAQIARLEARFEATETLLIRLENARVEKLDERLDKMSQGLSAPSFWASSPSIPSLSNNAVGLFPQTPQQFSAGVPTTTATVTP